MICELVGETGMEVSEEVHLSIIIKTKCEFYVEDRKFEVKYLQINFAM